MYCPVSSFLGDCDLGEADQGADARPPAAREDAPTLCDEDRVRLARRRHVHALPIERPDTGGHVAQGQVAETELPGVVPAPREDVATCAEGHNVRRRAAG